MTIDPYGTLGGLDLEERFIAIYLLIDIYMELHINKYGPIRLSNNNDIPKFTDIEVMCVSIVRELEQYASHRKWHHFLKTSWISLFPALPHRTSLLRREIALSELTERFRNWLVVVLLEHEDSERIIDSAPLKLAHFQRARNNINKRFRPRKLRDVDNGQKVDVEIGFGDIGYCASKKEHYFGMKLHVMCNLKGVPMSWMLTPASYHDIRAVDELVNGDPLHLRDGHFRIWGDKGYVGKTYHDLLIERTGHALNGKPRSNQTNQWPNCLRKLVDRIRKRVECIFSEGVRFLDMEKIRPATWKGLVAKVAYKMCAITLNSLSNNLNMIVSGKIPFNLNQV